MKTTFHVLASLASFAGMVGAGVYQCYPLVLVAMAGLIAVTIAAMAHKVDQRAIARKEIRR